MAMPVWGVKREFICSGLRESVPSHASTITSYYHVIVPAHCDLSIKIAKKSEITRSRLHSGRPSEKSGRGTDDLVEDAMAVQL
jgi:hypothetical protein